MFRKIFKKLLRKAQIDIKNGDIKYIARQKDVKDIEIKTYSYIEDNNPYHSLNIYLPKNIDLAKKYPLIIDIHGGGWFYGDKDLNGLFAMEIARNGFIVLTVSYRLFIDGATLNDMLIDIDSSIRYILNCESLPINKNKISFCGDSAGGQLALLLLSIYNSKFLNNIYSIKPIDIKVNSLILNHPAPFIHNIPITPKNKILNKFLQRYFNLDLFGKFYKSTPNYLFSDGHYFLNFFDKSIPILLIGSKGDEVTHKQVDDLLNIFKENGFNYDYYYEDSLEANHVYNVTRPFLDVSKKCNAFIIEFLNKNFNEQS